MVNGFTDMIAGSLNLTEPWYVEGAEFLPEEQEVHIYVGVREDAVFACRLFRKMSGFEPFHSVTSNDS